MKNAIQVRDLHYCFHDGEALNEVLHGITVDFERGKVSLLMGPSGSGKSTLLMLLGGLRRIQRGSITIGDTGLANASSKELVRLRRRIGFIFQAHQLIASLSVLQNVMMPLSFVEGQTGRSARRQALSILERVGLHEHSHKHPSQLSGGMKQRVAVARALVHQPELILADEPTASLDARTGQDVVNLLTTLSRESGATIVMVTHDPRITDSADRLLHLEDGRLGS